MSRARKRRRAIAVARYANRTAKLGAADTTSWALVRAMNFDLGVPWCYVRRYGEDFTRGGWRG